MYQHDSGVVENDFSVSKTRENPISQLINQSHIPISLDAIHVILDKNIVTHISLNTYTKFAVCMQLGMLWDQVSFKSKMHDRYQECNKDKYDIIRWYCTSAPSALIFMLVTN